MINFRKIYANFHHQTVTLQPEANKPQDLIHYHKKCKQESVSLSHLLDRNRGLNFSFSTSSTVGLSMNMEAQIPRATLIMDEKPYKGSVTLNVENLKKNGKDSKLKPNKPALDSVSMTSSTHFTIINGGYSKNKLICRRGRHITVYIMTFLFFIGVVGLIFAFNARAQRNSTM
ncbi:hypothetical protein ACFFRR_002326 [Megaselia abdita]